MTQLPAVLIQSDFTKFSGDDEDLKQCQLGSEFSFLSPFLALHLNIPVDILIIWSFFFVDVVA